MIRGSKIHKKLSSPGAEPGDFSIFQLVYLDQ
jgi:hypothetical protein